MPSFVHSSVVPSSAGATFAWHQTPGALQTLIPPWERVVVEQAPRSLEDGEIAVLRVGAGPFKLRWVARHRDFVDRGDAGGEFTDEQLRGPFARWVHRHIVTAIDAGTCRLEDRVDYALPLGAMGELVAGWFVRRKLARLFAYRHEATRKAVALWAVGLEEQRSDE